jgi:hypothetical protein
VSIILFREEPLVLKEVKGGVYPLGGGDTGKRTSVFFVFVYM